MVSLRIIRPCSSEGYQGALLLGHTWSPLFLPGPEAQYYTSSSDYMYNILSMKRERERERRERGEGGREGGRGGGGKEREE